MTASRKRRPLSVEEAFARLELLLVEERAALRCRDAALVATQAHEKEELLEVISRQRQNLVPAQAGRLRTLSSELRHNAILLAYARDSLRDALALLERTSEGVPSVAPASARGRRLHVIG